MTRRAGQVEGILRTIEAAGLGRDVAGKCSELRDQFGRWFSAKSWDRQGDGGCWTRGYLYELPSGLEGYIDRAFLTRQGRSSE